jgi:adenosylhomocysteine nucleosidase
MRILVTYAVDPEFEPWRKLAKFDKLTAGKFTFHRTAIASVNVDFLVTGMGPEYASRAMEATNSSSYDACICAGFAGALRAEYQAGDVFIPERVTDKSGAKSLICDPVLFESAKPLKVGRTLLSSPEIIASSAEKATLSSAADAVDMESFTVIAAAQKLGIPALAVRAISDTSDQEMPVDFSRSLDENGQISTGAVLRLLAGQPGKIAALMRLGRQSKLAAETLANFLLAYIPTLAKPKPPGGAVLADRSPAVALVDAKKLN